MRYGRKLLAAVVGVATLASAVGVVADARPVAAAVCPATTTRTWDGGAGTTAWGTAANWSGDVLPSATDYVCILAGTPGATVDVAGARTVMAVFSEKPLRVLPAAPLPASQTATLTLKKSSTIPQLQLGSATASGTLSNAGTLTVTDVSWQGGTISGAGVVNVSGQLLVAGARMHMLSSSRLATLATAQSTVQSPPNLFVLAGTGIWTNSGTATFLGGSGVQDDNASIDSQLVNAPNAIVRRQLTGTSADSVPARIAVPLYNRGVLRVEVGTLQVDTLRQLSGSSMQVPVRGATAETDYGVVTSTTAELDGTLAVQPAPGLVLPVGTTLNVIQAATQGSKFVKVTGNSLTATDFLRPVYDAAIGMDLVVDTAKADLAVAATPSPDVLRAGGRTSVSFDVLASPEFDADPNVSATFTLPVGTTLLEALPSQGTCVTTVSPITCTLGPIDAGGDIAVSLELVMATTGQVAVPMTVTGSLPDPAPGNNTGALTIPAMSGRRLPIVRSLVGDFNGDGRPDRADLVMSDALRFWVSLNSGGSSFAPAEPWGQALPAGNYTSFMVGKFTGTGSPLSADPRDDIVVYDRASMTLWLLASNGGAFNRTLFKTFTYDPAFIRSGDFNSDSVQDIATFRADRDISTPLDAKNDSVWYAYLSNGAVINAVSFSSTLVDTRTDPVHDWANVAPIVGDFVGAGSKYDDIAVYDSDAHEIWVLRALAPTAPNPNGSFAKVQWGPTIPCTVCDYDRMIAGDFFADPSDNGKLDLAIWKPKYSSWYRAPLRPAPSPGISAGSAPASSSGTWTVVEDLPWDNNPTWTRQFAGDFTGDGKADIANYAVDNVAWFVGVSNGSTTNAPPAVWANLAPETGWAGWTSADFTGDGKADISVVDPNGRILVGAANGAQFGANTSFDDWGSAPVEIVARQWVVGGEVVDPGTTQDVVLAITNPNGAASTATNVQVSLPAGVTYVAGSTTGATSANPVISASTLTWAGPFTVPANASLLLRYRVQIAPTAKGELPLGIAVDTTRVPADAVGVTLSVATTVAAAQTFGCGGGGLAVDPTATSGSVSSDGGDSNLFTGSYSTDAVDLTLPALGADFSFERCYNSGDATVGALGRGWSHSYAMRVQSPGGGAPVPGADVVLVGDDGQQVFFKASGGTFQRPAGARVTLVATPSGYLATTYGFVKLAFDTAGRLQTIRDRNNQGPNLTYDASGRLTSVVASGQTVTFGYNTAGLLDAVTLPDGRHQNFGYTSGLLTSATSPRGKITKYAYTANRLSKVTDPNNRVDVSVGYNSSGRVNLLTGATAGKSVAIVWDAPTRTATVTDVNGKKWKTAFAATGAVTSQTNPSGLENKYKYDSDFNLLKVTHPGAKVTSTTYDSLGNVLTVTDPAGRKTVNTWTPFNDIKTTTRVRGLPDSECPPKPAKPTTCDALKPGTRDITSSFDYDANGNLTQATDDMGNVSTNSVDITTGLVTQTTNALGQVTTYTYDARGLVTTVTSPQGRVVTSEYDAAGRPTAVVDALGQRATTAYDDDDNVISSTYIGDPSAPMSITSLSAYDNAGNRTSTTDPLGRVTSFVYDAYDRLNKTITPDGVRTVQTLDFEGLVRESGLEASTGAPMANQWTQYEYDDSNRAVRHIDPFGTQTTTSYNQKGEVNRVGTSSTDGGGHTTTFTFDDKLGRLVKKQTTFYTAPSTDASGFHPGFQPSADVSYHYDDLDRVVEVDDGDGREIRIYDSLSRLIRLKRTTIATPSNPAETIEFEYRYDSLGRVVKETLPTTPECGVNDNTVDYTYYPDGMLQTSVATCGATTWTTTYTYDVGNRLVRTDLPNGASETRSYDAAGRVASIVNRSAANAVRSQFDYSYDAVGNVLSRTSSLGTELFTYDVMNQLVSACFEASVGGCDPARTPTTWTFDKAGNRTKEVRGSTSTTTYTYSGDRLLSVLAPGKTSSYLYDADGHVVSIADTTPTGSATTRYTYDTDGHLVFVNLPGTTGSVSYTYDGDGVRRTERACLPSCASTKRFEWDKAGGLPMLVTERQGAVTNRYTYGASGVLAASMNGTGIVYQHDALGSVTDVSGAADQPYWSSRYEPYGKAASTQLDPAAPKQPFGFTGQYDDTGTGLQHLRARQYDPATGRFLAVDPIPSGGSSYAYVGNNPLNATDPSGMSGCSIVMLSCPGGSATQWANEWARIADPVWAGGTVSSYTGGNNFGYAPGRPGVYGSAGSPVARPRPCSGCGGAGGVPCRQDPVCRRDYQKDHCRGAYNTESCHYKKALARNAARERRKLCRGNPAYCAAHHPTVSKPPKGWKPAKPKAPVTSELAFCFFACIGWSRDNYGRHNLGLGLGTPGRGISMSRGGVPVNGATASACYWACYTVNKDGLDVAVGTPGVSVMYYGPGI